MSKKNGSNEGKSGDGNDKGTIVIKSDKGSSGSNGTINK
jgi:hypothetical protein